MTILTSRYRLAALAAAAVATLTVASGCAVNPGATRNPTASASGTSMAGLLTTIDGTTVKVPAGRPAVLFFFLVDCGACVGGAKAMAQARTQAAGRADFLMVDLDPTEPRDAIDGFRQGAGDPAMPTVTTGSADLVQQWKITQLSTAIVIDTTGAVTYRGIDPTATDLLTAIDKATNR